MAGLIETVARYDVSQWIFWAGAGISVPPPAAMPLGGELTRFVLETACGADASRRLLGMWDNAQRLCNQHDPTVPFLPLPRLESILNAIDKAENVARRDLSLIAGLGSLRLVPPNANHLALAALVLRGASVVTTNFDMAIQAGLRVHDPAADVISVGEENPGLFRRFLPAGVAGAGEVIHVHGSADFPMELGATLEQVKKGLDRAAIEWLDGRLRAGAVLVFVGYSASDAFDVTPWFGSRPKGSWASSAMVFLQHGTFPLPPQANELGTGFPVTVFENGDTGEILNALAGLGGVHARTPDFTERFDWRARFQEAMGSPPGPAARALACCAVCNELGVNVDLMDDTAYARAEAEYGDADKHPVHQIFPLAARSTGRPREEIKRRKRKEPGDWGLLFFYSYWGRMRRAAREAMPLDEILQAGRRAGEIEWTPYTSATVHVWNFLRPYLASPPQAPPREPSFEALLEATELLGSRGLADLHALNQPLNAHRARLRLEATRGRIDRSREAWLLKQYAEQSLIQGYAGCWRDFALCRVLLVGAGADDHGDLAAEARRMLAAAMALSRSVGDKRAQQQAAEILRLLDRAG